MADQCSDPTVRTGFAGKIKESALTLCDPLDEYDGLRFQVEFGDRLLRDGGVFRSELGPDDYRVDVCFHWRCDYCHKCDLVRVLMDAWSTAEAASAALGVPLAHVPMIFETDYEADPDASSDEEEDDDAMDAEPTVPVRPAAPFVAGSGMCRGHSTHTRRHPVWTGGRRAHADHADGDQRERRADQRQLGAPLSVPVNGEWLLALGCMRAPPALALATASRGSLTPTIHHHHRVIGEW